MAKAAAEVLIDDINRGFKKVKVVSSRLPRLRTDQTSTIMKVAAQSNVDTLLPIIRAVTRRTSSVSLTAFTDRMGEAESPLCHSRGESHR